MGSQRLDYAPAGARLAVAIQHDISGELRVYDAASQ